MKKAFFAACRKLQSDNNILYFEQSSTNILDDIERKTPSTVTQYIRNAINEIVELFNGEAPGAVALGNAVKDAKEAFNSINTMNVVSDLLDTADVVFCTLSSAGNKDMLNMKGCDLIVDEASACTESEILIPMRKKPSRALLVGDPKQLPATVMSSQRSSRSMVLPDLCKNVSCFTTTIIMCCLILNIE
jgi:AAA domain